MQCAYKARHSTETSFLAIKNNVHLAMSIGEATAVVFLDLSAAFDTIDTIHLTHQNATQALERLNTCLGDVKKWMAANKFKLKPDKTEFVGFGSKFQRAKLAKCFPVNILGNSLKPADTVRNLGV